MPGCITSMSRAISVSCGSEALQQDALESKILTPPSPVAPPSRPAPSLSSPPLLWGAMHSEVVNQVAQCSLAWCLLAPLPRCSFQESGQSTALACLLFTIADSSCPGRSVSFPFPNATPPTPVGMLTRMLPSHKQTVGGILALNPSVSVRLQVAGPCVQLCLTVRGGLFWPAAVVGPP